MGALLCQRCINHCVHYTMDSHGKAEEIHGIMNAKYLNGVAARVRSLNHALTSLHGIANAAQMKELA